MKHPWKPTLLLLLLFISAQLIGVIVVNEYVDIDLSHKSGKTVKNNEVYRMAGVEPPEVENESFTFVYVLAAVFIGTILVLLIIKFRKGTLWKIWYLLAVFFSLRIALSPFVFKLFNMFGLRGAAFVTTIFVIMISVLKVFKSNPLIHNFTEILMYGGIAALLVPVINMFSAVALLLAISIYDAYAVWKSKHMITMAEFQKTTNLFAGLTIPYAKAKTIKAKTIKKQKKSERSKPAPIKKQIRTHSAILGGGDIAFPLLFSGVTIKLLGSLVPSLIITATTSIALLLLLIKSEKGKFYPAMPFLSAGCFAGLLVSLLLF
jgi:presenilin-like A22 family membrane protease